MNALSYWTYPNVSATIFKLVKPKPKNPKNALQQAKSQCTWTIGDDVRKKFNIKNEPEFQCIFSESTKKNILVQKRLIKKMWWMKNSPSDFYGVKMRPTSVNDAPPQKSTKPYSHQ